MTYNGYLQPQLRSKTQLQPAAWAQKPGGTFQAKRITEKESDLSDIIIWNCS